MYDGGGTAPQNTVSVIVTNPAPTINILTNPSPIYEDTTGNVLQWTVQDDYDLTGTFVVKKDGVNWHPAGDGQGTWVHTFGNYDTITVNIDLLAGSASGISYIFRCTVTDDANPTNNPYNEVTVVVKNDAPNIDTPGDRAFPQGASSSPITWTVYDTYDLGGNYEITQIGLGVVASGTWSHSPGGDTTIVLTETILNDLTGGTPAVDYSFECKI